MLQRLFKPSSLIVFCGLLLAGCAGSGSTAVVARIGNDPLTLEDFEEQYAKNNGGWDKAVASTPEERERFLDLLVRFRLKVRQAYDRGLMADSSVRSELDGYEVTVATAYMIDKEIVEPKIKELYGRKREEVRASHILIRVDQNASAQDTLAAYNKALKVLEMVPKYSFDTLAATYSEDQSASFNKGDLGFFTAGRMVPEFEDAVYGLKVGEITPAPIRSQFGYHIVKLTGRQENRGAVRVSHLLRKFKEDLSDTTAVRDSVMMIYNLLKRGADFAETVRQYSEDAGSKATGGDIGSYDRERIPPEVAAVFYSTPLNGVSEPLRMAYGYHIFKITGFSPQPTFQEAEKDLRQQYQQTRYNSDYSHFARALVKDYKWQLDTLTIMDLSRSLDTMKTPAMPTWSDTLDAAIKARRLFMIQGRSYTVANFIDHVNTSNEFRTMTFRPASIRYMIERMSEAKMVEVHAKDVPARYPAFTKLLKEYQDGILLYRIEQDEVWKKVMVNDSLLKMHYDTTKSRYQWPPRVRFAEIYANTDSVVNLAYKEIKAGKDFGDVAEKYTMRAGFKEKKGEWGWTPPTASEIAGIAASMAVDSVSAPVQHAAGWSIFKILGKDTTRVKNFEEAKPELMSAYQELASKLRQEEWVSELKKQYPVMIDREILLQAFKRKPSAAQ